MFPTLVSFVFGCVLVLAAYAAYQRWGRLASSRLLSRRLKQETENESTSRDVAVVKRQVDSTLPAIDHALSVTGFAPRLQRLVEQSGVSSSPARVVMEAVGAAAAAGVVALLTRRWLIIVIAMVLGAVAPFWRLSRRRAARMKRFEEQLPDVLDLLARAIRAGHAFQTAMGMAATEMKAPAGTEFKRTFEEQNFGLPLKEALVGLSERVPLLDVRFFVTAVLIQRETGGNLAEILENLAAVVRERFKILRQVRVHSAHGRLTGYVLLGLPAFLAVALSFINPDHMGLLFREHMGHVMLGGAMVLQVVGYFWIRQVIRIEV
jgi:tight adherence protein B